MCPGSLRRHLGWVVAGQARLGLDTARALQVGQRRRGLGGGGCLCRVMAQETTLRGRELLDYCSQARRKPSSHFEISLNEYLIRARSSRIEVGGVGCTSFSYFVYNTQTSWVRNAHPKASYVSFLRIAGEKSWRLGEVLSTSCCDGGRADEEATNSLLALGGKEREGGSLGAGWGLL